MDAPRLPWRPPPTWPAPPRGWSPPPGWAPPADWPDPPPGWRFWDDTAMSAYWEDPASGSPWGDGALAAYEPLVPATPAVQTAPDARLDLRRETTWVMVAFLLLPVTTAVVVLAQHVHQGGSYAIFPTIVTGNQVLNLVLGIVSYLPVASMVPLALFLLTRSGQPPSSIGLGVPSLGQDVGPGLGLAAGSYGLVVLLAIVIRPLLTSNRAVNVVSVGHVPGYYIVWGIAVSLITAVTEEVLVNGYLVTRLGQLGWGTWPTLALSLTLRTTYHVYYGLGFLLTVPFGYLVTRSFQQHRRLNRAIAAHFFYDAAIFSLAVFVR